ncbi:zinc-binding dehydrogenase [Tunturiibacter empetritectus]|uniref:NADPH:quinone reductase-like Zn-dependent oxidoreductase n=2 Tax=Tunturiibacter TaxID=3154218 RepID=A0A852VB58_9BACT|nr:NADPH:quinone reductase-like Zn-dependent oxidoreductase [Edaphobacter lichenicola]
MKAVCVNANRKLEVQDVSTPNDPPPGHLIVDVEAAAINHGDKAFLANPSIAGVLLKTSAYGIWGASCAGAVRAVGEGLTAELVGRTVAIYRSLSQSEHTVGLWSEQALVPRTSCVVLPRSVSARDYSGSLVNIMTAHAFLEESAEAHKGLIVTAGNSATGLAMAALARKRGVSAIFLSRSAEAATKLRALGIEHVLATSDASFENDLGKLVADFGATAVFDGVGGDLTSRIAPQLPMNSTIYLYGLLGATAPLTISCFAVMAKNLVLKRFSNFASATVRDPQRLTSAISYLESVIDDPLFHTRVGKEFTFRQIDAAMAYEATPGAKAVFVSRSDPA